MTAPDSATDGPRPLARAFLILAAAFLAYANALPNGFVFDDRQVIVENGKVRRQDWAGIWTGPSWFPDKEDRGWRPLTSASFALDWSLHGPKAPAFRALNLALHGLNSWLLALLAQAAGCSGLVGLLAGLLFAVHPVHTEVLNPIVGRADLLATLSVLFSCLAYLGGRRGLALICFGAGLLAKESAVTFLFLLPLLDWRLSSRDKTRGLSLASYAAFAAVLALYLGARHGAVGEVMPGGGGASPFDNPLGGVGAAGRWSNALYVLCRYLLLLIAPWRLTADYSFNEIPVLAALAPRNLGAIAALAALSWGLRRWSCSRREAGFFAGFFLLTFALVSNLPFAIGTIMGERLVYLPSAGFCVLLALALESLGRRAALALGAALLLAYAGRCYVRNPDWKDDPTLFVKTLETSPDSVKAMVNAGDALIKLDRAAEARDVVLKAIAADDRHALSHSTLGLAYRALQEPGKAEQSFLKSLERDPNFTDAWVNLGIIYGETGRLDASVAAFEKAVSISPESAKAHNNLGISYKRKGLALASAGDHRAGRELLEGARRHYEEALRLDPEYASAARNLEIVKPLLEPR